MNTQKSNAQTSNSLGKASSTSGSSAGRAQRNNPLHGITLQALLTELVDHYGWETLAQRIRINCFRKDPSIKSSLKFLRKTPWAREKVEHFYLRHKGKKVTISKTSDNSTARPATAGTATSHQPAPPAAARKQHPPGFQADIWGKK